MTQQAYTDSFNHVYQNLVNEIISLYQYWFIPIFIVIISITLIIELVNNKQERTIK